MSQEKYIGMDVHQATISVAVMDENGNLLMECLLETNAATILEFVQGLRDTLSLTFEEGISAAWLHDLLKPHVSGLVVCDPRKAALLKKGNKSDRIDARKLAELLRTNQLKAVYHGEHGIRTLKELGRRTKGVYQDLARHVEASMLLASFQGMYYIDLDVTREAETRAVFGHLRVVPLCHGWAQSADARPDALGGTTARGTAAAEPFSEVSRLELSARPIPTL